MNSLPARFDRLHAAGDLPELLDVAYAAFEHLLAAIRRHQEDDASAFPAFVLAASAAANARDAVGDAPSLPPSTCGQSPDGPDLGCSDSVNEVAAQATAISFVLASRLMAAVGGAADSEDKAACARAAVHALVVCDLLGGAVQ